MRRFVPKGAAAHLFLIAIRLADLIRHPVLRYRSHRARSRAVMGRDRKAQPRRVRTK